MRRGRRSGHARAPGRRPGACEARERRRVGRAPGSGADRATPADGLARGAPCSLVVDGPEGTSELECDAVLTALGREVPLEFFRQRSGAPICGEWRGRALALGASFAVFAALLYAWKSLGLGAGVAWLRPASWLPGATGEPASLVSRDSRNDTANRLDEQSPRIQHADFDLLDGAQSCVAAARCARCVRPCAPGPRAPLRRVPQAGGWQAARRQTLARRDGSGRDGGRRGARRARRAR